MYFKMSCRANITLIGNGTRHALVLGFGRQLDGTPWGRNPLGEEGSKKGDSNTR